MPIAEHSMLSPRSIASSPPLGQATSDVTRLDNLTSNYLKLAQWSADGTSIIAVDYHNNLKSFILPVDLLDGDYQAKLVPYSIIPSAEPLYSSTIHPAFSLSNSSTTLVLSSIRDHPLRLSNILHAETIATYPLINSNTEVFTTPHSVQFNHSGQNFITGSNSLISVFDVSRNGEGPVRTYPTIPSKRKKIVGGGIGIKGIVSTLQISCEGILAAGTFNREIGLYAHEGGGDVIALFSIRKGRTNGGNGITQVLWSPCGRYLYVAERMSDSILVYDVRVLGKRLTELKGRGAYTNQRMSMDILDGRNGHNLWAGGADGFTRMWNKPEHLEGEQSFVFEWKCHQETVCSVGFHPFSTIIATCSGQIHVREDMGDFCNVNGDMEPSQTEPSKADNTLKIWVFA